jgi:hypothetical protein
MTAQHITTVQARHLGRPNTASAHGRSRWGRKELDHIGCEHTSGVRPGANLHNGRNETGAQSAAHRCCRALGLDTQIYRDAYLLGWANGVRDLVKQCAQSILRVAQATVADPTSAGVTALADVTNIHSTRRDRPREAMPDSAAATSGGRPTSSRNRREGEQ